MNQSQQVEAIVKAWAYKVEEKLAAEGIFADGKKSESSLGEWRLPFAQPLRSARLALEAEPVNGMIQLSWRITFSSMAMDDSLDDRRVSHIIGLCDKCDLAEMVEQALQKTRPSCLTRWAVSVYKETGKRVTDQRSLCWHTMNNSSLPTIALQYA